MFNASPIERMTMLQKAMSGELCRKAFRLLLCCSLLVASLSSPSQNLIPNPSFELRDTCPYTFGFQEGDQPLYWRTWLNSPDYFNACAGDLGGLDTLLDVPQNGLTFQYAFDGDAYVGMYCFYPTDYYREYIGVQMNTPLVVGQTYHVSFRANLAANGSYFYNSGACNNLGALFTMASNAWTGITGPDFPFRNHAQVYSQSVITDTLEWTLVSGSFVADSAYQYLVIGNFFDHVHTDSLATPGMAIVAYYLIDAVCVSAHEGCEIEGIDETGGASDAVLLLADPSGATGSAMAWA